MLSIFKQIMSLANSKTAWIHVVCAYWAMGLLPRALIINIRQGETGLQGSYFCFYNHRIWWLGNLPERRL